MSILDIVDLVYKHFGFFYAYMISYKIIFIINSQVSISVILMIP